MASTGGRRAGQSNVVGGGAWRAFCVAPFAGARPHSVGRFSAVDASHVSSGGIWEQQRGMSLGRWRPDSVESEQDAFNQVSEGWRAEAMWKTGRLCVPKGERYAIWRRNGEYEVADGPCVRWLFGARVLPLGHYCAEPGQYIRMVTATGEKQFRYGPAEVWDDPLEIAAISVHDGVKINSNEALVVYRDTNGVVERDVVHGPAIHLPRENEWQHRFSWHGASEEDPEVKVPSGLIFTKLRLVPDQLYMTVPDVRTLDDALINVRLMIFFELMDLEKMLDSTHDPIADFINGVSADVIDFAASRTFEQFKGEPELLNNMATYEQLSQRASCVGYDIHKVVFRGYGSNAQLQAMHDNAIESRTKMKLEREMAEREQALKDFILNKEMARAEAEGQQEQDRAELRDRLERLRMQTMLDQERMREELRVKILADEQGALHAIERMRLTDKAEYIAKVKELGGEVTEVLANMDCQPSQLIRVDGGANGPRLHLHSDAPRAEQSAAASA